MIRWPFGISVAITIRTMMCLTVLTLPKRNPELASRITVFKSVPLRSFLAWPRRPLAQWVSDHTYSPQRKLDLQADVAAWYFHSTPVWLIVMSIASLIFFRELRKLKREGADTQEIFSKLP